MRAYRLRVYTHTHGETQNERVARATHTQNGDTKLVHSVLADLKMQSYFDAGENIGSRVMYLRNIFKESRTDTETY